MRIISYNLEKISAEKLNEIKGKLQINSNITIKSIKEDKIDLIKDQIPLKFEFEFKLNYKPNFANILISGNVLVLFEKKQSREILKKWKSKKIEDSIRIPLFNFIFSKINTKALQIEEELNLPPHIPIPRIAPKQQTNYTG